MGDNTEGQNQNETLWDKLEAMGKGYMPPPLPQGDPMVWRLVSPDETASRCPVGHVIEEFAVNEALFKVDPIKQIPLWLSYMDELDEAVTTLRMSPNLYKARLTLVSLLSMALMVQENITATVAEIRKEVKGNG